MALGSEADATELEAQIDELIEFEKQLSEVKALRISNEFFSLFHTRFAFAESEKVRGSPKAVRGSGEEQDQRLREESPTGEIP
jgi:hypothetical protein